jgi:hypothetical protein
MSARYDSESLLISRLLREAGWAGKDSYPATPESRSELAEILGFLQGQNRLDSFWPRLTSTRPPERDDALQEIRVARFLTANGFRVVEWEPKGTGMLRGEFSVEVLASPPVFVEVKSPGWEGQLSQTERDSGRAKQEKYQDLQGGADDPWRAIRAGVKKAYPKFPPGRPSLLVIADDRFVPVAHWGRIAAEQALFLKSSTLDGEVGYFTSDKFENLGGVGLFKAENEIPRGLVCTFLLFPNPYARSECALGDRFVEAFAHTD